MKKTIFKKTLIILISVLSIGGSIFIVSCGSKDPSGGCTPSKPCTSLKIETDNSLSSDK